MEKETLICNLFGGPGISKTTTSAGIFSLLKLHSVEVELVPEFAKDLVWEERHVTLSDQNYVFGKQHHRIWRLSGKVDVVITDSPLLLNLIYGKINSNVSDSFYDNVLTIFRKFNNLNILLERRKEYNPNGRYQTKEQSIKIDNMVKDTLDTFKFSYTKVPGTFEAINTTTELILNRFNKEIKFKVGMV